MTREEAREKLDIMIMSKIKTKKFKCNGCGEDRPCFVETNQEENSLGIDFQIEELKCILDETNQTSYNWEQLK